jgi:hypothetical protein
MTLQANQSPRISRFAIGSFTIRTTITVMVVFVLTMALTGCSSPKDRLIIPGVRVGRIVIGKTTVRDVGTGDGSIYEKYATERLDFGFDSRLRVSAIEVFARNYSTTEGLGVGDTESSVVAKYGTPEIVDVPLMAGRERVGTIANRALHYSGIRFVVDQNQKITSIIVTAKGS